MKKIIVTLVTLSTIGCSSANIKGDHGTITGSPEFIHSFFSGVAGVSKTAKESPDSPNQYLSLQALREGELTKRNEQGFFKNLLNPQVGQAQAQ